MWFLISIARNATQAEGKEKQRSATRSHEAGRQFSSDASRQAKSIPTSKVASARPRDSSYNAPPAGGSVSSRSASHDGRTMVGCGSPSAEQQIFLRLPSKRLAFPASGDALLSHCKRAIQHISNQRLCYKIGLTADPVQFMSKSAKRMSPFKYMTIIYQHRVSIPCPDVAISDRATCAMLQRISKRQAQLLLSRLIQHIKLSTKDPYCKNRDGDAEAADGADPADFLHHFSLYVVHTG